MEREKKNNKENSVKNTASVGRPRGRKKGITEEEKLAKEIANGKKELAKSSKIAGEVKRKATLKKKTLNDISIQNPRLDRRYKLSDYDREEIRRIRETEGLSYDKIAKQFSVSKRTIMFICDPAKLEANKKKGKERGGSGIYYDKEKNSQAIKEHRAYKKSLIKKGFID